MGKIVSVAEYAKHRGISPKAVYKAIGKGRIEPLPGSGPAKLDQDLADRQWKEFTGRPRGNAKPVELEDDSGAPPPKTPAGKLRARQEKARTEKMELEAIEADLDARKRVGDLVNRPLAREEVFSWFRQERDSWRNFPARFSAQIASELEQQGVSHRSVNAVLEKYVDQFLEERGDVEPPDFRGPAQ